MRIVRIVWHDSGLQHESGWLTPAQIENRTSEVSSVGYVIHEDDDNITLAMGWTPDPEMFYGVHTIWKPSIIHTLEMN